MESVGNLLVKKQKLKIFGFGQMLQPDALTFGQSLVSKEKLWLPGQGL